MTQGAVIKTEMDAFEAELQALEKRGVKYLLFVDDTFNVPKNRFKQLMTIVKKHDFHWYAFIRCQFLNEEFVLCRIVKGIAIRVQGEAAKSSQRL